ncbi:flagellar biosynthetic protein FliO [Microbacterium arborescens]|uniref:flagellar biosynthetic protein FliO n=1 Tax=Microbacterium arborescens TaxID=33883 RepID=UPI00278A4610|nr:flagellar biosynthetic protein FliO [Microbacterium arborescens]MDQ1217874.1 flagellar protein FliO/FliZ [Microbacterium arborescens]
MLAIVWVLQRRFSRGSTGGARTGRARGTRPTRSDAVADITVVAKRGIGPKAQVAVVEIDGARYVLGITEGGVSMLDRIDPTPDTTTGHTATGHTATAHPAPADAAHGDDTARPALRDVAGDAPLAPPVPLLRAQARAERTARTTRPATMTARDAAQVLRRALGA